MTGCFLDVYSGKYLVAVLRLEGCEYLHKFVGAFDLFWVGVIIKAYIYGEYLHIPSYLLAESILKSKLYLHSHLALSALELNLERIWVMSLIPIHP